MSELLRKDKTCLNCGHAVEEKFCSRCGQKNIELRTSAWHTIFHFIGDYFHADGKFFKSIIPLLIRPGFLTRQFIEGKRAAYINPFRLYIFISIIFFIFYTGAALNNVGEGSVKKRKAAKETSEAPSAGRESSEGLNIRLDTVSSGDVTGEFSFPIPDNLPATEKEYLDSISLLPESEKPGWLQNKIYQKIIRTSHMDNDALISVWLSSFFHNIPKMLFVLLPFIALFLKLLYIRRKRYYIDHFVFVLHTHAFLFLIMLVPYILQYAGVIKDVPAFLLFFIFLVYLFLAMKKVYHQNWLKTSLKYIVFIGLYMVSFVVLILINLIVTTASL